MLWSFAMSSANQASTPLRSSALRTSSGDPHVPNALARLPREDLGHLVEAHHLRPGQCVRLAVTPRQVSASTVTAAASRASTIATRPISGGRVDRALAQHADQV